MNKKPQPILIDDTYGFHDDPIIRILGQISSSQNTRVIDPRGISYAMANGEKGGEPNIIELTPWKSNLSFAQQKVEIKTTQALDAGQTETLPSD